MSAQTRFAHLDKTLPAAERYYVLPFFTANATGAALAGRRAQTNRDSRVAWTIAALTHAAITAHAPRNWPRRDSGLTSLIATAAVGTAAVATAPRGRVPATRLAIIGLAGSGIFARWYASFGRQPSKTLSTGNQLPDLSLQRLDGTAFNTQELRGAPAAIYFYRGNWCPFCTTQINDVVAHYQALTDRGVKVVMISPQPEHESRALADRFDVDSLWLTDPDLNAAQQLGITDPDGIPFGTPGDYGHDTVLPTLIVSDDDLTILGTHETDNFRQRPDPSIVLTILDRNQQPSPAPRPQLPGALAH